MFEKGRKYMIATTLMVLLVAGFAAAIRPGITIVKGTGTIDSTDTTTTLPATPQLIGGQTDSHGCLGPAGFSWNETTKQCVRPWSGEVQLATGTMMVNISDPNWKENLAISVPVPTSVKCIDSDNGKDYYTAGKVYVLGKNPKIDVCMRHRIVREWYCSGDQALSTTIVCKEGCKNDACIPELVKTQLLGPPITSTTSTTLKSG